MSIQITKAPKTPPFHLHWKQAVLTLSYNNTFDTFGSQPAGELFKRRNFLGGTFVLGNNDRLLLWQTWKTAFRQQTLEWTRRKYQKHRGVNPARLSNYRTNNDPSYKAVSPPVAGGGRQKSGKDRKNGQGCLLAASRSTVVPTERCEWCLKPEVDRSVVANRYTFQWSYCLM